MGTINLHLRARCPPLLRVGLILLLLASTATASADESLLEYKVKATYLYKFGEFVSWPPSVFESPTSAINVCVVGNDPFGDILNQVVVNQLVAQRPINVRRFDVVERNSACHVLYVGGSDRQSVAQALDAVGGTDVLTVTAANDGDVRGIVNFVTRDGHVRFDIDEQAAARNGLTISSKLLALAVSFRPKS